MKRGPKPKSHCRRGHEFTEDNTLIHGNLRVCKACKKMRQPRYRKNYKERYPDRVAESQNNRRNKRLKLLYDLTPEQYQKMYDEQEGKCVLPSCGLPISVIDHDHVSGLVRGLMCRNHNLALGLFYDNPQLLDEAIDYLERTSYVG